MRSVNSHYMFPQSRMNFKFLSGGQATWFSWGTLQLQGSTNGRQPEAHRRYGGMGTILVSKVSAESAYQFGELVADPVTNELLHYTEKPETFLT
ncbi:uncharacterized protein LOC107770921 isoform X2 [Nicotiana tabacum]|uniref:Uncharacterized protein LOC107770921 isoform X2 n=4 Tax=Nicotiana tabacum TaxID=4097 RepID=A0AC58U455_TOBAC